jgi:hypothetical protein
VRRLTVPRAIAYGGLVVGVLDIAAALIFFGIRAPVVTGLAYGVAAWLVMNFVVLPLSAAGAPTFRWPTVTNGILIHMFGVGLPSALFARAASRNLTQEQWPR